MTYPRIAYLGIPSLIAAAGLAFAAPALAGEAKTGEAPELAGFVRTGELQSCLWNTRVDTTKIVNSEQILFRLKGGDAYLNDAGCSGARKNVTMVYDLHGSQLCSGTIVRLIDSGSGMEFGSCALGQFEKLEKKTAAAE